MHFTVQSIKSINDVIAGVLPADLSDFFRSTANCVANHQKYQNYNMCTLNPALKYFFAHLGGSRTSGEHSIDMSFYKVDMVITVVRMNLNRT